MASNFEWKAWWYEWFQDYSSSTLRVDENMVRAYIRNQEEEDERYEQMKFATG